MRAWLKTNSEAIGSFAAIAGLIVSVLGFGLTIWQLSETSEALRASNTYNIQKDARELINEVAARKNVVALIAGNASEDVRTAALDDIWKMLNFYLSVYRQAEAGGISSEISKSFGKDFCQFISRKNIPEAWDEMDKSIKIDQNHKTMKDKWCNNA